mmetsp:Transcript_2711/g.12250  ORF Transcript_2711/g.12250 Transcript_2711/m.12250 type:complete len:200 (+) Transcript_2711:3708-4307(+)
MDVPADSPLPKLESFGFPPWADPPLGLRRIRVSDGELEAGSVVVVELPDPLPSVLVRVRPLPVHRVVHPLAHVLGPVRPGVGAGAVVLVGHPVAVVHRPGLVRERALALHLVLDPVALVRPLAVHRVLPLAVPHVRAKLGAILGLGGRLLALGELALGPVAVVDVQAVALGAREDELAVLGGLDLLFSFLGHGFESGRE